MRVDGLNIERNEYGTWDLILRDGTKFRIRETAAGDGFILTAQVGVMAVLPQASNSMVIKPVEW